MLIVSGKKKKKAGCNLKEQAWQEARDRRTTWTLETGMREVVPLSLMGFPVIDMGSFWS